MAGSDLDAVMTAIGDLPVDATDAPDAVLVSRMRQLVQARAMVDAALAGQVAAFDARAGARYDGQTSTMAWLRSRLRLGGQAVQLLRVARHLDGLPQLAKAFAAGEVTLEHAAAVATLVSQVGVEAVAGYETILLDLARQVPPAKLRVACAHVAQLLDAEGDDERAARQHRQRHLTAARTVGGMVHLQGLLDPASGDVVLAALRAAMPAPAEHEERTASQRRADALVDVCAGWMAAGEAPTSGGVRPQVQLTVSLRTLQTGPQRTGPQRTEPQPTEPQPTGPQPTGPQRTGPQPTGPPGDGFGAQLGDRFGAQLGDVPVLADGQPVSPSQARRIACDAGVVPVVLGGDSEPLDIGRLTRVVPAGMRRALNLRDGGCRFAGCDRPAAWCDAHHLRHWADGGDTDLANLILVCSYHHTLVHEGWQLHGDPRETVWFRRPDGTRLDLSSAPRGRPATRGP